MANARLFTDAASSADVTLTRQLGYALLLLVDALAYR